MSLAEDYASRFKVESLGVYDALKDVWRHQNNTSDFATPSNVRVWFVHGFSSVHLSDCIVKCL